MKKLIAILMFSISFVGMSQKITDLKETDFELFPKDGRLMTKLSSNLKIESLNGADEILLCGFELFIYDVNTELKTFNDLNLQKIRIMVFQANLETKYLMKNKYTYCPKKIKVGFFHGKWLVDIKYIAQNDYGATKDDTNVVNFNKDFSLMNDTDFIENEKNKN